MKVAICTLGCKVNQYETQALEQELLHRGHTLVDFEETADAYVVNTCSVTAVSDKKSRQMLRQAQRRNPSAVIAACGCYAQTHPEDVKKLGLDVIAGTNDRAKFIDLLERAAQDKTPIVDVDDVWERRDFEVLPAGGMVNRTRAMLKVEDGCVNFCTYCLIPYARGRVRSLPMDEAAKQVKALREEGYREIVVTGIEISSYGSDFKDGTSLIDLLELIAREGSDIAIDQIVIGSCTNGQLPDMAAAAAILKGHHLAPNVRGIVIPATQAVYRACMHEGYTDIFLDAGCIVSTPTCGPCLGGYMGILAAGERCVSTTNRNFVGRMGHVDSEVYLASPAVAAASGITGHISHPEEVMNK